MERWINAERFSPFVKANEQVTQVTASLKVKKMRGGPGKKDGVVLRDSHCF